jgi:hypothetical protein
MRCERGRKGVLLRARPSCSRNGSVQATTSDDGPPERFGMKVTRN